MPTATNSRKRGRPVKGQKLVNTIFHWRYWCDICGKDLYDQKAIYRPSPGNGSAGGWCLECGLAYGFLDLRAVDADHGDPDTIEALYHFTDTQNVPSILQHGILSMDEVRARRLIPAFSSTAVSRDMDAHAGLSKYVRLTLHPHHPMAWKALYENRSNQITWIKIDPAVLQQPGTLFSDKNALCSDRTVDTDPRTATRGTDQAEAMVLRVPVKSIVCTVRPIAV